MKSVCGGTNFNFMHFLLGKCGGERVRLEREKKRLDDKIGVMRFIVSFLPVD